MKDNGMELVSIVLFFLGYLIGAPWGYFFLPSSEPLWIRIALANSGAIMVASVLTLPSTIILLRRRSKRKK